MGHVAYDVRRLSRASLPSIRLRRPDILLGRLSSGRWGETGSAAALSKRRHTPQAIRAGMLTAEKRQATTACSWAGGLHTFTSSMGRPTYSMSRQKSRGWCGSAVARVRAS